MVMEMVVVLGGMEVLLYRSHTLYALCLWCVGVVLCDGCRRLQILLNTWLVEHARHVAQSLQGAFAFDLRLDLVHLRLYGVFQLCAVPYQRSAHTHDGWDGVGCRRSIVDKRVRCWWCC